ncbi:MAG: hypothetical protein HPPSJP_2070 [Candidatus Hepatoplasma scabrum]|nr:MAG: hypothetical protein HPPSJP_2070 [Candidatus Hepatoplasma sp.]
MQNKYNDKFDLSNIKFKIWITDSVDENILIQFKKWTDKYKKFIKYKKIINEKEYKLRYDNFLIKKGDIKYFTNLKRKFKKYVNASFKIEAKRIIYLNDNKILDYKYKDSENKIRPYYIKNPNTLSNHKIILFQISSKRRSNLKRIEINNNICYLNWEEPIIVTKFKLFKILIET